MRKIILRTARHELVAAFTSPLIEAFIDGPCKSPPDVVFWGSRVFSFATMNERSVTYSESFSFAIVDGQTATRLSDDEMHKLPSVDPISVESATVREVA